MIETVMIVGQDDLSIYNIANLVEAAFPGCRVLFASSISQAYRILSAAGHLDFIIASWSLGEFSGFDIAELAQVRDIPILISDCSQEEFLDEAPVHSTVGHLEDGFDVGDLRNIYFEVLESRYEEI